MCTLPAENLILKNQTFRYQNTRFMLERGRAVALIACLRLAPLYLLSLARSIAEKRRGFRAVPKLRMPSPPRRPAN